MIEQIVHVAGTLDFIPYILVLLFAWRRLAGYLAHAHPLERDLNHGRKKGEPDWVCAYFYGGLAVLFWPVAIIGASIYWAFTNWPKLLAAPVERVEIDKRQQQKYAAHMVQLAEEKASKTKQLEKATGIGGVSHLEVPPEMVSGEVI